MAASVSSGSANRHRQRRVAIVGGGPAGMAACRFLVAKGHIPVVLERGSDFGGIWAPQPTNQVVYKGLVTNIPKFAMQSFDFSFPEHLPSYIRGADLGTYFRDYVQAFDLKKFVRFGVQVTSVQALCSEVQESCGNSAWRISYNTQGNATSIDGLKETEFDAVVIATGHYEVPYLPEVPGQSAWLSAAVDDRDRTVTHAQRYDDPSLYVAHVVLVVGGRSSAVDIARELRPLARWVYVLEKSCGQHPVTVGNCTHVPIGTEINVEGQLVYNGTTVPGPPVTDILLATGYQYDFPFLDGENLGLDFGPVHRYVAPLYMHVHARRPSLCFIGIPLSVPTPLLLFEAQARFAAAHLSEDTSTSSQRDAWVNARRAAVGDRSQDMHFMSSTAWAYMRELVKMSGLEGSEYKTYSDRLSIVEELYKDRCMRRPQMPWDDDTYRQVEYAVDWEANTWRVVSEPSANLENQASL